MKIYDEQEIMNMKPQELTSLLYEAFLEKLRSAIKANEEGDFIASNIMLQKCNDILNRLGCGINYKAGVIADQLETLYDFCSHKLIEANVNKDKNAMLQVLNIMENISEAWNIALEKAEDQETVNNKLDTYDDYISYESSNMDVRE